MFRCRVRFLATGVRWEKVAFDTDAKLLPFRRKKKCLRFTQDTWRILTPPTQTLIMKTADGKIREEKSRTAGASGKAKGRKGSSLLFNEKPFHLGCDLRNIFMVVMSLFISSSLSGVPKGDPHFQVWIKRYFFRIHFNVAPPFLIHYFCHIIFICFSPRVTLNNGQYCSVG